jgi:hypothetical protein
MTAQLFGLTMRESAMSHRIVFSAPAAAFMSLASVAAHADCKTTAVDNCLVGTWKQTGGGVAEWMREHMKNMAQIKIDASGAAMTLNSDGTFSTSKVDTKSEVTVKEEPVTAMGNMSTQGSGRWSAADGTLTLCMTAIDAQGSMSFKGPDGKMTSMKMPQMKPTDTSMSYTCEGDTLSTVQTMPMGEMTRPTRACAERSAGSCKAS